MRLPQVLKVAAEVSRGMDYLHQRKIIHRDLKAANLLMDEHGIVKVGWPPAMVPRGERVEVEVAVWLLPHRVLGQAVGSIRSGCASKARACSPKPIAHRRHGRQPRSSPAIWPWVRCARRRANPHHIQACTLVRTCDMFPQARAHTNTSPCAHAYTRTHTPMHTCIHTHAHTHTHTPMHTHTCTHTHTYTHTYIHTHTCTTPHVRRLRTLAWRASSGPAA